MPNLDYVACSATDKVCTRVVTQKGVVDYRRREYCCAECAYITLSSEGIEDPIECFSTFTETEHQNL